MASNKKRRHLRRLPDGSQAKSLDSPIYIRGYLKIPQHTRPALLVRHNDWR